MKPLKFIAAGALNTAITYVLYLLLQPFLHYTVAFSITFAAGIVLGYVLNLLVFGSKASGRSMVAFPLLYLANYASGLALIAALIELCRIPKTFAPLISTAVLTPVMFVLSRQIFKPRQGALDDDQVQHQ